MTYKTRHIVKRPVDGDPVTIQRRMAEGREAALGGLPLDECPYVLRVPRQQWIDGWRKESDCRVVKKV